MELAGRLLFFYFIVDFTNYFTDSGIPEKKRNGLDCGNLSLSKLRYVYNCPKERKKQKRKAWINRRNSFRRREPEAVIYSLLSRSRNDFFFRR